MLFRYYTNAISQATRGVAMWIFMVGLLLIGFGVIIIALPEIFAALAALVFAFAGLGCIGTAVKIFWAQHKFNKMHHDEMDSYRHNVRVREDEFYDL